MERIRVELGERAYDICLGEDLLPRVGELCQEAGLTGRGLLVSNPLVYSLYGGVVESSFDKAGISVVYAEMDDGEEFKNLETVSHLYDVAIGSRLDRTSFIIALGGGVVGDVAGFVAATYLRGVPFVQIPTTLQAQVDSSVGGKVAVDHPRGKNLIGAFYQPALVIADIGTLSTLEPRQMVAGMAEVIKYGIIWDKQFLAYVDEHMEEIYRLDPEVLTWVIKRSCQIKSEIVGQDERDEDVRTILNYGHTIGHALEVHTGYRTYLHGEAISIGMSLAAEISLRLGNLSLKERTVIDRVLQKAGLPIRPPSWDVQEIFAALLRDKKVRRGVVRFVLPRGLGQGYITDEIPRELVLDVLRQTLTGEGDDS
ncbi:MAG: 3-dehydroquinate synthase [Limnochordia bacterium]|jgi:3-dehydroquinate synthase|nr:3-dehydroquinate synthase [Bacillota bacterium]